MFKKKGTIKTQVETVVKSHTDIRGEAWLLQLGFGECNDYAASVASVLQERQSTVERYIREYKEILRAKQPKV